MMVFQPTLYTCYLWSSIQNLLFGIMKFYVSKRNIWNLTLRPTGKIANILKPVNCRTNWTEICAWRHQKTCRGTFNPSYIWCNIAGLNSGRPLALINVYIMHIVRVLWKGGRETRHKVTFSKTGDKTMIPTLNTQGSLLWQIQYTVKLSFVHS